MKTISTLLLLFAISATLCLGEDAKPNLDDLKVRAAIEKEALEKHQVEYHKEDGQILIYSIETQKPYTGWAKAYHGNGVLKFLGSVKDGKPHGLVTQFHDAGQKKSEHHYRNGMAQGIARAWYWSGQKQEEAELKDDAVNGLNTTWHENGQKMSEGRYQNGLEQGLHASWHESGQKKHEFNYKDGMLHGLATMWDKEGTITSQIKYENGKQVEEVE